MATSGNTFWTIIVNKIPLGEWLNISAIYDLVSENFNDFTKEDFDPVIDYNNEPRWHRNLRNALQRKRGSGEILYDGNANYRIDRPYVWRMIKEAVNNINPPISYSQIRDYIDSNWSNVNPSTITAQIIVLTVNHNSRTHYPENQKSRLTNSNSPYDLLYTTGRGQVVMYNEVIHGVWEVLEHQPGQFRISQSTNNSATIFTPSNIIWFKNVTNSTKGEAYLDITETQFVMHFPTKHRTNVLSPAINELILIYQKVHGTPAFTHIVTPIDNEIIEDTTRIDYRFGRRVKVIAKTECNNFIPVNTTSWGRVNFSGITQGNACRLENVSNIGNIDELQFDIWRKFTGHFIPSEKQSEIVTTAIINEMQITNPDVSVTEGELKLVSHFVKERNPRIIREKKQEAIRNNTLACEVCAFSFVEIFNKQFIECHHKTPIATSGIRETTLEDLALVCANCHRMLHTKFNGEFLTVEQLRQKLYE